MFAEIQCADAEPSLSDSSMTPNEDTEVGATRVYTCDTDYVFVDDDATKSSSKTIACVVSSGNPLLGEWQPLEGSCQSKLPEIH